jgi:hypothetical protein
MCAQVDGEELVCGVVATQLVPISLGLTVPLLAHAANEMADLLLTAHQAEVCGCLR